MALEEEERFSSSMKVAGKARKSILKKEATAYTETLAKRGVIYGALRCVS